MPIARRARRRSDCESDLTPLTKRWLLRMLVPLNGHKEFISRFDFSDNALADALGFETADGESFDPSDVLARLRRMHRAAEAQPAPAGLPSTLAANVERLARLVGLQEHDCRVLEFATLLHNNRLLDRAADTLSMLSSSRVVEVLATILDLPRDAVQSALGALSPLSRTGLLTLDRSGNNSLTNKLDLLSKSFGEHILASEADPISLLRDTITPSTPPTLTLDDFSHLGQGLAILSPYLQAALASGRQGANILLHGAPGTGKSELSRALAQALGCELFEVASEDEDGDPISGEKRLRAYRAAQCFFGQRHAMILFDEVEDVFNDGDSLFGRKSTAQRRKAWLNRTLEQNAAPTLWLSNAIDGIDPAFIRRFDLVLELPVPPRRQRERILQANCGGLVDQQTLGRIAQCEQLAPAVVNRAASVLALVRDQFDQDGAAQAFEWMVDQSLQAQGHASLAQSGAGRLPAEYDPSLMNPDMPLADVAGGLARVRSARLCLYGPPGTGKSAFGHWLAGQLDMPLLLRRASDLLSKYVGENEKNIAQAFRQAESEGAILMIDEVDSFLRDRERARAGWEATMVNEMLTRMETFDGIFIASTNLMDGLDQAALRRFDLKVRFGYMRQEQALLLLQRYCERLQLGAPQAEAVQRLRALHVLAPGDFAATARRHRFAPLQDAAGFVAALEQECLLKQKPMRGIGFLS